MDYTLIARLLVAHVLGDYVLQPDAWVAQRNQKQFRAPYLYLHALVQTTLALLFCFSFQDWWIALTIGLGHLILDGLKALFKQNNLAGFVIDQLLHVLIIIGCWLVLNNSLNYSSLKSIFSTPLLWWLLSGILLIAFLHPKLIALAIKSWRLDIPKEREPLYRAGRWIGIMERLLVFVFVLLGQYAAIGFLLAAKSIFRFGDLRESKDKGHTEYVLIGTLLSFSLAIFTGILFRLILGYSFNGI
ncbi:MAG: DUF3307 domain-containing protein [Chitinophagaceae bacterium]